MNDPFTFRPTSEYNVVCRVMISVNPHDTRLWDVEIHFTKPHQIDIQFCIPEKIAKKGWGTRTMSDPDVIGDMQRVPLIASSWLIRKAYDVGILKTMPRYEMLNQ